MFVVEFSVHGRDKFPVDMLRRDQCFPANACDSASIEQSQLACNLPETRLVVLRHFDPGRRWLPNSPQWTALGWPVLNGSVTLRKL